MLPDWLECVPVLLRCGILGGHTAQPGYQQRAQVRAHHWRPDALANAIADCVSDACADGHADSCAYAGADTSADTTPVPRRFARMRPDGRWHLLRKRKQQLRVRLQDWLLGALPSPAARVRSCDSGPNAVANLQPYSIADVKPHSRAHTFAHARTNAAPLQ